MLTVGLEWDGRGASLVVTDSTGGRVTVRNDPQAGPGGGRTMWPMHPETLLVSAARPAKEVDAPVNEPVHLTSTFVGWEAGGGADRRVYGRMSNPSWDGPEQLLAALEGVPDPQATPALLFSSGMAAVTSLLDLVGIGGGVVAPRHAYNGSVTALADAESRGRLHTTLVDITDTAAVIAAMEADEDCALLWLESPTNPALEIADIAALAAAAHKHGVPLIVDATEPFGKGDQFVIEMMREHKEKEPESRRIAAMNWRFTRWLVAEAGTRSIPVVPTRPRNTLAERILAVVSGELAC